MNPFSLIVAVDNQNGIGKDNDLPWHLPADLKYFKRITTTANSGLVNAVIMGRKTWDSIPEKYRPLPERVNVVCTRNSQYIVPDGVILANSLENAFTQLDNREDIDQVFVIGGQQIFEQALLMDNCQTIYMTHIDANFECDAFFPPLDAHFTCSEKSELQAHENFQFYFAKYNRNE